MEEKVHQRTQSNWSSKISLRITKRTSRRQEGGGKERSRHDVKPLGDQSRSNIANLIEVRKIKVLLWCCPQ
jgi:hypothetical protein